MPYPFILPTTSAFVFTSCFTCESHPSLLVHASTQRGVLRNALKTFKRLPAAARAGNLASIISSLNEYIPYLLAIEAGVASSSSASRESVCIKQRDPLIIKWKPSLSDDPVPARKTKLTSLEHETTLVLSTLAFAHILSARYALQPLFSTTGTHLDTEQRKAAIQSGNKSLLDSASVFEFIVSRNTSHPSPPCIDLLPATARALASLALAEATLLAATKDDAWPAAVAQMRNKRDKEWMFKSPEVHKTKAHLNARLCLAASDHAAKADSLLQQAASGTNKVIPSLPRYIDSMRRTARAKACRFFGIHAESSGETGNGIGWLRAGLEAIGAESREDESKQGFSLGRLKQGLSEKREDRRVEKETSWGTDAGLIEERRVLQMLDTKWTTMNDTMNTQHVPSTGDLLAKMPSGREICAVPQYRPPCLTSDVLQLMRGPCFGTEDVESESCSDEEGPSERPGPMDLVSDTRTNTNAAALSDHKYY